MPELMVDFITSLDGYASAEGWPGLWGFEVPEYLAWLGQEPVHDDTILIGANTYRLMYGFATQSAASDPDETSNEDAGLAELTNSPKVVFSSTLQQPLSWANTRVVSGDAVEAVRGMKRDGANSLRTLGSLTLCRSLLEAGLVDRFPRGPLPGDHWQYRPRADLRRLSRCRPRHGRQPDVRRQIAVA